MWRRVWKSIGTILTSLTSIHAPFSKMEVDIIIQFILFLFFLSPLWYTLYLYESRPWGEMKTRRKLHGFTNDEWIESGESAMAIDTDEWRMYVYRFKEE